MSARAHLTRSWPKIDKCGKVGWFQPENEIL
jgi:hypothetical protein